MLIALGAQTGIGAVAVARKQSTPIAFLVPLAGTLLLAAWLLDPNASFLVYCAPLLDLGIVLALSIYAIRTYRREDRAFEVVLRRALDRWLPGKGSGLLAGLAALDIGGFVYIAGGWRRPAPVGLSYHRNNATFALVALVAISALPELFIVELFLAGKPLLWHAIDIVVHAYAIFWCFAMFVSFRNRPHTLEREELVLRRGLFETIRVPLSSIENVEPARPLERHKRRSLDPQTAYLGLFDSPLLELTLRDRCELERAIGRPRMVETIFFAVDEPQTAISEIRRRLLARPRDQARVNAAAE